MCGIAGMMRSGPGLPGDRECVARVLAAESHRGPDGDGIWQEAGVVLGHRRLAIIDLSESGLQPMANEDASLHITFNGEIYNFQDLRAGLLKAGHQFHSGTDTEVLLHGYEEWGIEGLLQRLRGMFAFALYDSRRGLIFARDRMGIKPLYYSANADCIIFASEVKALMRSGLVPDDRDRRALAGFLMAGSVPQPLTHFKAVSCLPPGNWAEWGQGTLALHPYWDLDQHPARATDCSPSILGSILADAVRQHLIADVPLGIFLSGGVDSTGLVALARRMRVELTTLTVIFDERQFSEAPAAAETARRFGTIHREIRVTEADFKNEIPAFFAAMDQPTNDGVNSYFVSKAAREAGLKVVLSGLGGDEVFWGYPHYKRLRPGGLAENCPPSLWRLLGYAGHLAGNLFGRDNLQRAAWLEPAGTAERLYLTMRGFFAPAQVARLMDLNRNELDDAVEEHFGRLLSDHQPDAAHINYLEMKRYLHDQLLRDTDVFSMAHSIEARVPFLDHVLVEQVWGAASARKLSPEVNKPLLIDAINDATVREAARRPKQGFTFPMAKWMAGSAPHLRGIAETGCLERAEVRECWNGFSAGRVHWSRAWALTVLAGAN